MSEKKEKAGRRGRAFLKVLLGIVCVIVLFVAVTTVITIIGDSANLRKAKSFSPVEYENQLQPETDEYGNYCFTSDEEIKLVQLTDIHIGGGWLSLKKDGQALNAAAAMLTAEKPDFVVVTGDIGYPIPFQSGTFNNKSSAKLFAELMENLGVYWTVAFGNHDTEAYSYYDRDEIADFYMQYPHCLLTKGPEEVDGVGNQIINIKRTDGTIMQTLYVFDSNTYTDGDVLGMHWKYDNIHENQIEWYKASVELYNKVNAEACEKSGTEPTTVKSLAFFHIPIEEYRTAWYEYAYNGFENTEDVKYVNGTALCKNRVIYCAIHENQFFETMQEVGQTQGLFCGHDHSNNFSIDYKGIRLTYGMSIDYLAIPGIYKVGAQRGCTVITVSPDGSFECTPQNYYQDKYTSLYAKEDIIMQPDEPITDFKTD